MSTAALPAGALATCEAYLAALADPQAGGAFWDLHAPDAWLVAGGEPVARAAIAREAYAAAHAAATGRFEWAAAPPEALGWAGDDARGVAWLALPDAARGEALRLACGLAREDGAWRVAWAALVPGDGPAGFGSGAALALAEYPYLPASPTARGWLDVAYARRWQHERPALHFLPGARFSCGMTANCCKVEGSVVLPPVAQAVIDALPLAEVAPQLVGTRLDVREDGQLQLKGLREPCRFLDEVGHCQIHKLLGTPVFPACVLYPLRFTATPDGVAVSTASGCLNARDALGAPLESWTDEIHARLAVSGGPTFTARPRLTRTRELAWDDYLAAEAELRAALALEAPLQRRLWVAVRLLEARLAGRPGDVAAALAEAIAPPSAAERLRVEGLVPYTIGVLAMIDDAFAPATAMSFRGPGIAHEARAAWQFQNVLFAKDLAARFGLATALTQLVLTYVLLAALEGAAGGPADDHAWWALGVAVDHRVMLPTWDKLFSLMPVLADELEDPALALAFLRTVAGP